MDPSNEPWVLHYWHMLPGRGEYIRLVFEEAGVPFQDNKERIRERIIEGEMGGYPVRAPPVLTKGDFKMCQTTVICEYLGQQFGLYPDTDTNVWRARQINQTIHDFQNEARNMYHGHNYTASYHTQQAETQVHIDRFRKERLARWLQHFEALLAANTDGKGFVLGDKLTYVDLALLQVIRNCSNQFSSDWMAMDLPLLKAFKDRMEARPNLAKYFKSDRYMPFEGNSMF